MTFFTSTAEGEWEGAGERVIRVYIRVGLCGGRKGREARGRGGGMVLPWRLYL